MNILYLCSDSGIPVLGNKGAAVHVRQMISAFQLAGHRVVLAAQTLEKSPWDTPARLNCPVIQIKSAASTSAAVLAFKEFCEVLQVRNSVPGELRRILYNRELASELDRRFQDSPPDLIYERASLYGTAGVLLAQKLGIPLIIELNAPLAIEQSTYRATGFGSLAAEVEKWTLCRADAVAVVSANLREHVQSLGVASERIHVLPNGVDPSIFRPAPPNLQARAALGLNGGPVLGFVGGLRPWHGVEILPELLTRLLPGNPGLRLLIAGDGPLRGRLEQELASRGVASNVTITGLVPHEQIPEYIRHFDIALAPYCVQDHAFYFSPLKLFEYMACGIAVIAPNIGQISAVLQDGKTGLLYPAGDIDALTEQCRRLLKHQSLRRRLGRAAAAHVLKEFTWDRNAQRIVNIAKDLQVRRGKPLRVCCSNESPTS